MKLILLILLVSLCLIISVLAYSLIYPLPTTDVSFKATDVNEAYFINKLLTNHIKPGNQNQLIITEEELNGYIAYRLNKSDYEYEGLTIRRAAVKLMEQSFSLTAYGNYGIVPIRIEVLLIPTLQQEGITFTPEEFKLSRIRLPKGIANKLYNASQLIIPFNGIELIKVKSLILIEGEAVISYEVDKERILEELFKLLIKQSG